MTDGSQRAEATLSYDNGRYVARHIPIFAALGVLGLGLLYLVEQGGDAGPRDRFAALLLAGGGFCLALLAWWRSRHPGEPTLVLSTTGMRYRLSRDVTLTVPWHEVAGVGTTDVRITTRGFGRARRGVPTVLLPRRCIPARANLQSWWQRERWQHTLVPKAALVQVAIHDDLLGVPADELYAAIDKRWRAFSRRPDADGPPLPYPGPQRRSGRARRKVVWAAVILALVLAAPLLWHWRKAYPWLAFPVPSRTSNAYLDMQLDRMGALARTPDGAIITVLRHHVAQTHGTDCRKDIARDASAKTLTPSYTVTAACLTDLVLTSGTQAVAVLKLKVHSFQTEYALGKFKEAAAIVAAPLDKDEARRLYCEMRSCSGAAPPSGVR